MLGILMFVFVWLSAGHFEGYLRVAMKRHIEEGQGSG
jgi:hypothetical protein